MRSGQGYLRGLIPGIIVFICLGGAIGTPTASAQTVNQLYFSDDFENGLQNWETSTGAWVVINTDFRSGSYSVSASPNGNYADHANSIIESASPIDLSGAAKPILSFWHKYSTASSFFYGWDYCYVEISQDYGITWTQIASFHGTVTSWTHKSWI